MKNTKEKNDNILYEVEIDEVAYKKKKIFVAIILFPLFAILFFTSLMFSVIPITTEASIDTIFICSLISVFLGGLSILVLRLIGKTNLNGIEYFNKLYLSGGRTPYHSWEYNDNKWKSFAIKKNGHEIKEQKKLIKVLLGITFSTSIILFSPTLIAMLVWIITMGFVFYFMEGRKERLVKEDAFFHTEPVTLDFYDKGLVIAKKYYIPFNTFFIKLNAIKFKQEEDILYIEIMTNHRAGRHPDANIIYHTFPVPTGKEHEEFKIRRFYNI